jgi:hypothetical protein
MIVDKGNRIYEVLVQTAGDAAENAAYATGYDLIDWGKKEAPPPEPTADDQP